MRGWSSEGLVLIHRRFLSKLSEHGVSRIEPLGERFDPHCDEAVSTVMVTSPEQDGVIVNVVARGYRGKEAMLRPALVLVGQLAAAAATPG